VFSRFARGGKTTVLISLFHELQKNGRNVMFISFNGASGFVRNEDETEENCILRQIATQLIDPNKFLPDDLQTLTCDEKVIDQYIDQQCMQSSIPRPFILVIDELNARGAPLSSRASRLLQRLFLLKDRYLVFSTHVPYDQIGGAEVAGTEEGLSSPSLKRSDILSVSSTCMMAVVSMPQCNSLEVLQSIDPSCKKLTPHLATLYGGVPSLVFSTVRDRDLPFNIFTSAMTGFSSRFPFLSENERMEYLRLFVDAVFDGDRAHIQGPLLYFDQFASMPKFTKVRWVLCYLTQILVVFSVDAVDQLIKEIHNMARYEVPAFASMVEVGLDWQCVVDIAVLLRAVQAYLKEGIHPMMPAMVVNDIEFISMPAQAQNLNEGYEFIKQCTAHKPVGHLMIIRSTYAKFPLFDGFVVGVVSKRKSVITGYQVKFGRNTPSQSVPSWVNGGGLLIRGAAPEGSSTLPSGWTSYGKEACKNFLGYSLEPLYPDDWLELASQVPFSNRFD